MSKSRAPARHVELSGLAKHNKHIYEQRNNTDGIVPKDGSIVAPKGLSKPAKKAWDITVNALLAMRTLSVTDFVQLENLFMVYDELLKARKALKEFDNIPPNEEEDPVKRITARRKLSSWFLDTQSAFNILAGKFGMTPSERTNLPKGDIDESKDPLDTLIT